MDEDPVRIVPVNADADSLLAEDESEVPGRGGPPIWVILVVVVSTVGLVAILSFGPESDGGEFRTVYSVPGYGENSFEAIRPYLQQPTSALGYEWSLVAILDPEFGMIEPGSSTEMVAETASGLVAVGRTGSSAAVWSSVDGAAWTPASAVEESGPSGYSSWMSAAAVGGPGLVAVGGESWTDRRASAPSQASNAAVWGSVDGDVWARLAQDEEAFGPATLSILEAAGPGLVAFGEDLDRGVIGIWVSSDADHWVRVAVDDSVFADATILGAQAWGSGLVAVGYTGLDERSKAAVWVSPDGLSWSMAPYDDSVFGGNGPVEMHDITKGGPGLVAVGGNVQGAVVWTSDDGFEWSRVPHNDEIFASSLQYSDSIDGPMLSVVAGQSELLAVGPDGLWASNDGITWIHKRHERGFDGLSGQTLIPHGSGYVLMDGTSVWVATPIER